MSEDFKPKRPSDPPEGALAQALAELMEGRSFRVEATHQETANAALPDAEAGCPESGEWSRLLSGAGRPTDEARITALFSHAAQCGACRPAP